MLQEKIIDLKKNIAEYAGLVRSMAEKSVRGLLTRDGRALADVIEKDEPIANEREIVIDDLCTELIARHQPAAGDLRTILMILKMNNDLERLGDHAVNIAQSAQFLIQRPSIKPYVDIPLISELAFAMFSDSLTAFINGDTALARTVCARDNQVDDLKKKILAELSTIMARDPETVERGMHLVRITGNIERIADLATNICEDVLFMVEGRVIKHHHDVIPA